jgi:hypothetical protein
MYTLNGEGQYDWFGGDVGSAGDINNDGYDDMFVGAPTYPNYLWQGRAYVFFGGPGGSPVSIAAADADRIFTGEAPFDLFGWSVTNVGDIDNDNYNDLAVGAPDGGNGHNGITYIFSGQTSDVLRVYKGEHVGNWYGRNIASNGDFNADGINDLLVGAFRSDSGGTSSGRVYAYFLGDPDADGALAGCDNCPEDYNPLQEDADGDDIGDACDGCCLGDRGDVDGSGSVDVSDLTYLVDYLFGGGPAPVCLEEADVDGSGSIDVSDLTYIVDYLFGGGAAPVACP